mgnify:CR=1 FL=1
MDLDAWSACLRVLADPTRVRLLALLEREELTVAELSAVTRLAQPRVSTHLAKLKEADLVRDRRGAVTHGTINRDLRSFRLALAWAAERAPALGIPVTALAAYGYAGGLTPAEWLAGPGTVVFDDMAALPALLGVGTTSS